MFEFYGQLEQVLSELHMDKEIELMRQHISHKRPPIDNIIQDRIKSKFNIDRINGAWSKISDYNIYLAYQKKLRKICLDFIPMDIEFRLFNEREK